MVVIVGVGEGFLFLIQGPPLALATGETPGV